MRQFSTGATRDNVEGKLSYMRALSPAVLKGYVQYLNRHRQTANGLRAFDNWKNGIDQDIYMDSLLRHTQDAILAYFGEKPAAKDFTTLLDLLYAIMFNTNGMIFELLVEAGEATRERCTPPAITQPPEKVLTCGDCAKHHGGCALRSNSALADPECFAPKPSKL